MDPELNLRSQGAEPVAGGVRYRTWAPGSKQVEAIIFDSQGAAARAVSLGRKEEGYFSAIDPAGGAGDRYKYRLDGKAWPDPASRFNPDGVHGVGQVIDPGDFAWDDDDWSPPPISALIIYELHIGTFTPEGTFRAAIDKLDHLVDLGVSALEIMPVADFPGRWNWGYDGVLLYAPARVYGRPNDLRALVDAAHGRGLAVILDVVYNHLGPDGNYLGCYSRDYFNPAHKTPWGDAFNFELEAGPEFFCRKHRLLATRVSYRRLPARCHPRHRGRIRKARPGRDCGESSFVRRFCHGGGRAQRGPAPPPSARRWNRPRRHLGGRLSPRHPGDADRRARRLLPPI